MLTRTSSGGKSYSVAESVISSQANRYKVSHLMLHSRTDKLDTPCVKHSTVMYNNSSQSSNPSSGSESFAEFYNALCALNAVFSVTAFAGNFLVLGAIWITPALQKPTNILLLGLALSDLSVGLLVQPMFIVRVIYKVNQDYRQVFRFTQAFFISATILTLTSVSVERCLALVLHLRYVAVVTVKNTLLTLCLIWLASLMYAGTFLIDPVLHRTVSMFVMALCIVVSALACSTIYRICRRHRLQIQSQSMQNQPEAFDMKRYRKSLTTMIALLIVLFICYTPYICLRAVANFNGWPDVTTPYRAFILRCTASLVYLNSSINPVIYCWRISAMRVAMKQVLKSLVHRHST